MSLKIKDLSRLLRDSVTEQVQVTLTQDQSREIIDTLLGALVSELEGPDGKVELDGFGKLTTHVRQATVKSHPRNPGEMISIAAKRVVKFQAFKGLREAVSL